MNIKWQGRQFLFLLIIIFIFRLIFSLPLSSHYNGSSNNSYEPIRSNISKNIDSLLPDPQSSVFKGIVFGIQEDLDKDLKNSFANTSTIHIIVASGQNLTILAVFILSMARYFGRKKVIIVSLFIEMFYCLITGLQIPILRAFLMISMSSFAQLFNRDWDSKNLLYLTCLAMLVFDPDLLFSISFQLSFLSTFAVLAIAPILIKSKFPLPKILKEELMITISAQMMTLPVIAANFHRISLVGVFANILILWTITPIMFLGFIGVLIATFNIILAKLVLLIPYLLVSYLIEVISFFDSHTSTLNIDHTNINIWTGYYFILLGIVIYINKNERAKVSINTD